MAHLSKLIIQVDLDAKARLYIRQALQTTND